MTELERTDDGMRQVKGTGLVVCGVGKLSDPARLAHVFISPRRRAKATFDILLDRVSKTSLEEARKVTTTERLGEWDYGQYEGLTTSQIRHLRKEHGLDRERPWDIWRDGCEGGEYVARVFFSWHVALR